jgi:hypothetical protein
MWQKNSSRKGLFLAGIKHTPVLESPYERLRPLTWMPDRCNFKKLAWIKRSLRVRQLKIVFRQHDD